MTTTRPRLGELLVARGLLTEQQLAVALAEQRESRERLGSILVRRRLISQSDLFQTLADTLGVAHVDLADMGVDVRAAQLLPEPDARRLVAVPLHTEGSRLVVAMADPADVFAADDIRGITGWRVAPVLADSASILMTIDRVWGHAQPETPSAPVAAAPPEPAASVTSPEVVTFVDGLLFEALRQRATEVHLDPAGSQLAVRFRIDDVIREVFAVPEVMRDAVVTRFKILAELDLGERHMPQDGWLALDIQGRRLDIRMVVLPTAAGEAVSLRIRDLSTAAMTLQDLGFVPRQLATLSRSLQRRAGLVLVAGPAGSGRSTTLYAAVAALNDGRRTIATVEDPLEYRVEGARQVQVHQEVGLTFPVAVRAALRTSPDVLMVGEIRDVDTASLACDGALMGHMVLAGMHGSDAPATLLRLCEMGLEPYLVTSALSCIVVQRLVRRLCERCTVADVQPDLGEQLTATVAPGQTYYRAQGCDACANTGYVGRVAIHEVLTMTEEIARLVAANAGASAVRVTAVQQGMSTLLEDGLQKATLGLTSLDELRRICG